jgi:two-component system, LuxR family, response regulator FixJ
MNLVPAVFLVDSDLEFAGFCRDIFEVQGYRFLHFPSPRSFLEESFRPSVSCLLLQWSGADWFGQDLCDVVRSWGDAIPILATTSEPTISECSQAFRAGAVDYLEKPLSSADLWHAVARILELERSGFESRLHRQKLADRLDKLTDREEEVARALGSGQSMKEIALEFGTSFQSVARHRQRILTKLQVDNDVALANFLRDCSSHGTALKAEFDKELSIVHDS